MSFFDQRYYAENKFHLSVIGIWPEQSRYVKIFWPLLSGAITSTAVYFMVMYLTNISSSLDSYIETMPSLCMVVIMYTSLYNIYFKIDKLASILMKIKSDWEELQGTKAVVVLHKFAERGRKITSVYTVYVYGTMCIYTTTPFLPLIYDMVKPLNESRPKDYLFPGDYGVDTELYFWPIFAHAVLSTFLTISINVGVDTLYSMLVEHACALFEIVGFNLNLATAEYIADKKVSLGSYEDAEYEKICDCMQRHKDAIRFAGTIENFYSGSFIFLFLFSCISMSLTGVQALININHPEVVLRLASFCFAQAFHLFFNSLPGQKLMDHSLSIGEFAYQCDWTKISLKAQKLLIPLMCRSSRPCILTAGKVYVISMENYSQVMQTAASYFTMFSSLR